jgi:acetyltransferase-like isoleucine patch superfamily enzyme
MILYPNRYSNSAFIKYLRKNKVVVGNNTVFYSPLSTVVDVRKPYLIKIGNNCKITHGTIILSHDYSIDVCRQVYGEFVGGSLPVVIGDNVFIGMNSIILMGTKIGNNSIIGANSLVKGEYPDNVVIAGNPAKVICTLDEYYDKLKKNWVNNAYKCAEAIYNNSKREPTIDDMSDGYLWLYVEHNQESVKKYDKYFNLTADNKAKVINDFLNSKSLFPTFEDFIDSLKKKEGKSDEN